MRMLIIGGSDAGISAALRAQELDGTLRSRFCSPTIFPTTAFAVCRFILAEKLRTGTVLLIEPSSMVLLSIGVRGHPHRRIREKGFGD